MSRSRITYSSSITVPVYGVWKCQKCGTINHSDGKIVCSRSQTTYNIWSSEEREAKKELAKEQLETEWAGDVLSIIEHPEYHSDNVLFEIAIDELLDSPAGQKLRNAMETISAIQRNAFALTSSEDPNSLKLIKIGTVFQIFLINTLASGKKAKELTEEDWKNIAKQVSNYAILSDGQSYSVFVFTLYADYIDLSALYLQKRLPQTTLEAMEASFESIKEVADTIRSNSALLQENSVTEVDYIQDCLWLSLEGMIKLLSASLAAKTGPEFAQLAQAVSQLAFEYGRYVLFAKEQALLESYLEHQCVLDEQLQQEYDAFLVELKENADRFQGLIDAAFSPGLHDALIQSAELARSAGVAEDELLSNMEDIDNFFLN